MSDRAARVRTARIHLQSGRRQEAAQLLQQVLAEEPHHVDACWLLGRILDEAGRSAQALPLLARAAEAAKDRADILDDLGLAAANLGRLPLALRCHRQAAQLAPRAPGPRVNEGAVLARMNRLPEALTALDDALARQPGLPFAARERARVLRLLGRPQEALDQLLPLLAARPDDRGVLVQAGLSLQALGQLDAAVARLRQAVVLGPRAPMPRVHLARALMRSGDPSGALEVLQGVVGAGVPRPPVVRSAALLLAELGRVPPALRLVHAALQRHPAHAALHELHGTLALKLRQLDTAVTSLERAVALEPGRTDARRALAHALRRVGRSEEGLEQLQEAVRRAPRHPQAVADLVTALRQGCMWGPLPPLLATLDQLNLEALAGGRRTPEHPLDRISRVPDGPTALAVARSWCAGYPALPRPPVPPVEGRLRIAYLTSDLRDHPVAWLLDGLYAAHDRDRVEVFLYSLAPGDDSAVRARAIDGVEHFVSLVDATDDGVAARIRRDGIHVLVDLLGWTEASRLGILAWRPAPVQATWLGHPGSTGAAFVDHVVLDPVVCPPEHEAHFVETVWRIPCYQANGPLEPLPPPPARSALGLPDDAVVFCSMNQPVKLEPVMWAVWMRLLRDAPGSVLWLLRVGEQRAARLRAAARDAGVDPERLVFAEWAARPEHIVRLQQADLVLDTRVWGGHTSTSDALRAGVPVLTLCGTHMASRVAASLLARVGVDDSLVVHDLDAYRERALALAGDPGARQALRVRIAAGRGPLFDPAGVAAALEDLYEAWVDALP